MKKILLLISLNITKTEAMQPQYIQTPQTQVAQSIQPQYVQVPQAMQPQYTQVPQAMQPQYEQLQQAIQPQYAWPQQIQEIAPYGQTSQQMSQIAPYNLPDVNANLKGWSWFVVNFLLPMMNLGIGFLILIIFEMRGNIERIRNKVL